MNTTFYDANSRTEHIETLLEVVKNAGSEVLAITSPSSDDESSSRLDEIRRTYFDVLLNKCESEGLRYHRIVQLQDNDGIYTINVNYDRLYREHFKKMLVAGAALSERGSHGSVELTIASLTIPGTFVIVDRSYFAWEICELDHDSPHKYLWRSRYALQMNDPAGVAFAGLAQAFERVFAASRIRSLDEAVLRVG